jgi:peptide/nickel transport system substrate-binding protein
VRGLLAALLLISASVSVSVPVSVSAADLVIGRASEQFSLDPQFAYSGNNIATATDMFDSLLGSDAANQPEPGLAVRWEAVDKLTWRIHLRENVRFHDGSVLTAEDVVFSLRRVKSVVGSPASYLGSVRGVVSFDVVDPLTLEVKTAAPMPLLVEQIGTVNILSAKAALGLSSSDLNAGRGLVGTGPYRFVRAVPGERVEMQGFPAHWGGAPRWDRVTLRFMPNATARVAALLSREVDLIDQVAPADAKMLGSKAQIFSIASTRLVYLALDSARDVSPFITDASGGRLDRNPLRDPRVRLALSKSIDREALASRLLDGSAEPAGQLVPQGMGGFDAGLVPAKLDLAGARRLLAEAGYANGFGLTLHGSNDRLPQDSAVAQALGQMFRRAGLAVKDVVALPYNVYAQAASRQEYSLFLFSIGSPASNSSGTLSSVLATYDSAQGLGGFNRGRYSNAGFDRVLGEALSTFDEAKRNEMLAQATRVAMDDTALIPLYWQVVHFGAREGVFYAARRDEVIAARFARAAR